MRRVGLGLVLVAAALIAYMLLRGDNEASGEERYDGVHLCSPSQQKAATVAAGKAGPTPAENAETAAERTQGPLFAQNSTAWGGEEYDAATKQDVGCGATIAQCGCAMTSVATVLALFQLMTTPDGNKLNPSSLNSWFNEGAQLTDAGWVSQGYSYGNVVWTAVNSYSKGVQDITAAKSVRYVGWGSNDEDEIRRQLAAGKKLVGQVPGHFIAILAVQGPDILINDPYYANRTTLASYKGLLESTRIYEVSDDLSGIMISVPAGQRVKITDSQGREVGTLGGKDPKDAEENSKSEIPGASFHFEEAWRDPTCTEKAPEAGQGVNSIFIPNPTDGNYKVEVLGAKDEKTTNAVVYIYDKSGNMRMLTPKGADKLEFSFTFGGGGAGGGPGPGPTLTPTPTPTPTASPTPTPPNGLPPEQPTSEDNTAVTVVPPGVTITVTPTKTATPTPTSTGTVTQTPGQVSISTPTAEILALGMSGQTCGTRVSWNALGDPSSTVELLRNGIVIFTTTPGQRSFTDAFSAGGKSYQLRGKSTGGAITMSQSINVNPWCLQAFNVSVVDCDGDCYHYTWTVAGNVSGHVNIIFKSGDGGFEQVGSVPISPSSFENDADDICIDSQHKIVVSVAGLEVTSPTLTEFAPGYPTCGIG